MNTYEGKEDAKKTNTIIIRTMTTIWSLPLTFSFCFPFSFHLSFLLYLLFSEEKETHNNKKKTTTET